MQMNSSENIRGAVFMVVAMAAFTANDAALKLLGDAVPLFQIILLRGVMTSMLIAGMAWQMGALTFRIPKADRGLIALRCLAEAAAAWFFLTALFHMPIADLTAILQALPLSVTLAGAVFLREPVGWRRFIAIGIGFYGVLLIIQPGADGISLYALLGLATVAAATMRDIVTRKLSRDVPSLTVTFFTALSVGAFGGVMGLGQDWVVMTTWDMGVIVFASLMIMLAYFAIIVAMRTGEIGFVAPFRYSGLLVALVLGWVLFREWPDLLTLVGAGVLIATGIYTLYREAKVKAASQKR
ncbi:DMT family transporter [Aestuariibius sp. HNIBRBA575]|uniref:DMT family transporter n=1 Tax=Aestuariibius sp. HNIBRBA575 TaxID=3233343 RepID=UPI0034A180A5